MTDEQKPDLKNVEPITTWSDSDQPPDEQPRPASAASTPIDRGAVVDPVLGSSAVSPLVDEPGDQEPRTSPETESELDRLRRG